MMSAGPLPAQYNRRSPAVNGKLPDCVEHRELWDSSYGMDELSPEASPIARAIFERMREHGLSQKALALRAGLNEGYVRDLFRGKSTNPRQAHLAKIAGVLGCSILDLIDPGATREEPKRGEVVNKPDELAFLNFYRILSLDGRRKAIQAMIDAVPGLKLPRAEGNDI